MVNDIQDLPDELLLYMFMYLDDTDLQTLEKVSHHLRKLVSDVILWKNFWLVKNSALVTSKLFRDSRPDRVFLVNRNVLKGVDSRQIQSGQYINSPSLQLLHENQNKIHWLLREQNIRKRLNERPLPADLEKRGVLPHGVQGRNQNTSPLIVARAHHLKKALKQAVLYRKLSHRQNIEEVHQSVLKGAISKSQYHNPIAPSLMAKKVELEKQFNENALRKKFDSRPPVDEIETRMTDPREVALMVCPGVKQKIKTFEKLSHLSQ